MPIRTHTAMLRLLRATVLRGLSRRALVAALAAFAVRTAPGEEGSWSELGTHVWAAAQPTATGRTLGALQGWNGKLYVGYGDYGANTGPIHVMAFDPARAAFTNEFPAFETEAIYVFRPLFGRLYIPPIDPRSASGIAVGRVSAGWSFQEVFMTHGFDVATLTGGDLWLVGSSDQSPAYGSTALRSVDDGATWQLSLNERTADDDWSRYYFAGVLNGRLYVQSSETNRCRVFDGTVWSEGPDIARHGAFAQAFDNKMVLLSHHATPNDSAELLAFDGVQTQAVLNAVYMFTVSGGSLYALGADQCVRGTTNLSDWVTVCTNAPDGSRSLAVLNNRLYVGTTQSVVQVYSEPLGSRPTVRVLPTQERASESGASAGRFTVRRTEASEDALTVRYAVSGSAAAGEDYVALAGTVTIPGGADSAVIDLVPIDDRLAEGPEFVTLALVADADYAIEEPAEARIMIDRDSDGAVLLLTRCP